MAESATNRGVNTIEAGEKNLDSEFSQKPTKSASLSEKRNKAKKQKKAKRQNKKHGRR